MYRSTWKSAYASIELRGIACAEENASSTQWPRNVYIETRRVSISLLFPTFVEPINTFGTAIRLDRDLNCDKFAVIFPPTYCCCCLVSAQMWLSEIESAGQPINMAYCTALDKWYLANKSIEIWVKSIESNGRRMFALRFRWNWASIGWCAVYGKRMQS